MYWRPYVPVAQRRAAAAREMKKLRRKGKNIEPIEIQGLKIAHTFWGEAWCKHLEQFSDYANRLPRGRTYVRNGSVCHLEIRQGKIEAIVSGSELYNVSIDITPLSSTTWRSVRKQCAGQIGSILELLQGKLSGRVMKVVSDPAKGLFPHPKAIKLHCDCPDWAGMCKHVAAVLYGVGARLDNRPELLFTLRKVDHEELISAEPDMQAATEGQGKRRRLANQDLSNVFGIDIDDTTAPSKKRKTPPLKTARRSSDRKSAKKGSALGSKKLRTKRNKRPPRKKTFTGTGAAVARLRKQYEMTRAQFADLLGVSPQTVTNWETTRGRLNLQQRSLNALIQAWTNR